MQRHELELQPTSSHQQESQGPHTPNRSRDASASESRHPSSSTTIASEPVTDAPSTPQLVPEMDAGFLMSPNISQRSTDKSYNSAAASSDTSSLSVIQQIQIAFNKDFADEELPHLFTKERRLQTLSTTPSDSIRIISRKTPDHGYRAEMVTSYDGDVRRERFPFEKRDGTVGQSVYHKAFKPFYGDSTCGKYVINIPQGAYAKCFITRDGVKKNFLLDSGIHVISDPSFSLCGVDMQSGDTPSSTRINPSLVQKSLAHINHGNCHILTVPQGQFAIGTIDNKNFLLEGRRQPYFFTHTMSFALAGIFNNTDEYHTSGALHRVFVPYGKFAMVVLDGQPSILNGRELPYIIEHKQQFIFVGNSTYNLNHPHIRAGNLHRVCVPRGEILCYTQAGKTNLLFGDGNPHVLDQRSGLIKIHRNQNNTDSFFYSINTPYIRHGNLVRLVIPQNKLCACVHDGEVKFLTPSQNSELAEGLKIKHNFELCSPADNQFWDIDHPRIEVNNSIRIIAPPTSAVVVFENQRAIVKTDNISAGVYIIDSTKQQLVGVVDMQTQTISLPTPAQIQDNQKTEGIRREHSGYIIGKSPDQTDVGIRLDFFFRVTNPCLLAQRRNLKNIREDVATLVFNDMITAISRTSFRTLRNMGTDLKHLPEHVSDGSDSGDYDNQHQGSTALEALSQRSARKITRDLEEIGLEVIRIQLHEVVNLDRDAQADQTRAAEESLKARLKLQVMDAQRQAKAAEQQLALQAINFERESALAQQEARQQSQILKQEFTYRQEQETRKYQQTLQMEQSGFELRMAKQQQQLAATRLQTSEIEAQQALQAARANASGEQVTADIISRNPQYAEFLLAKQKLTASVEAAKALGSMRMGAMPFMQTATDTAQSMPPQMLNMGLMGSMGGMAANPMFYQLYQMLQQSQAQLFSLQQKSRVAENDTSASAARTTASVFCANAKSDTASNSQTIAAGSNR